MGPPRRNLIWLTNFIKLPTVECVKKTFLHPRSFFHSICGVGLLEKENQTLWLPKSFSDPVQTCNKPIQGYLVQRANSQKQIKLYLVNSAYPPRCLVCPRYHLCRIVILDHESCLGLFSYSLFKEIGKMPEIYQDQASRAMASCVKRFERLVDPLFCERRSLPAAMQWGSATMATSTTCC